MALKEETITKLVRKILQVPLKKDFEKKLPFEKLKSFILLCGVSESDSPSFLGYFRARQDFEGERRKEAPKYKDFFQPFLSCRFVLYCDARYEDCTEEKEFLVYGLPELYDFKILNECILSSDLSSDLKKRVSLLDIRTLNGDVKNVCSALPKLVPLYGSENGKQVIVAYLRCRE
ncbi:hypothetical protein H6501_00905 [Candidatus Woesearchaeota archaeon]|nr:hypothetical protein [Candidatus Woesearchaeota archaeon]USN44666.1 MAG: hypothetical protein H6500_02380 [Candidatus Woesearchaeota archaeon]